jgi:hypothetical protein
MADFRMIVESRPEGHWMTGTSSLIALWQLLTVSERDGSDGGCNGGRIPVFALLDIENNDAPMR